MNRRAKIWLVTATSLVAIGLIIFTVVMALYNWNFTRLSTVEYETKTYKISEEFSNISINTDTADILFDVSSDGTCKIVCNEYKKMRYSAEVTDDTLNVSTTDNRKWYDHIGINFYSPKVTVYLPKTEYNLLSVKESTGDIEIPKDFKFVSSDISLSTGSVSFSASVEELIKIQTSTGNIGVKNISAGTLDLSVSTGEVSVLDVMCKKILSSGSTGDIYLKNVNATEKISIKRSTGNVRFDGSDATEIFVKTGTGDVGGSLLSEKVFITKTSTGSINVPKTTTGGKCEIITSTGNIIFK